MRKDHIKHAALETKLEREISVLKVKIFISSVEEGEAAAAGRRLMNFIAYNFSQFSIRIL